MERHSTSPAQEHGPVTPVTGGKARRGRRNGTDGQDDAKLAEIRRLRAAGKKWRDIARAVSADPARPVNPGTVWKWDRTGHAPRDAELRRRLGLPVYGTVAYCDHCGELPVQKRHVCPARKGETKPRRRRVRYSERDTMEAIARCVRAIIGTVYSLVKP